MSNLEQLRRDGATIKQIAHRTGTSYGALRKQWSVNGWHSPIQHRRTLIAKVIDRGTPSEIAEFLVRYHEVRMTPAAIRAVRNRLKRARG